MEILVAVAQMDPQLGKLAENRSKILSMLYHAVDQGANLVVFPECALSGYGFANMQRAWDAAEAVPGETVTAVHAACAEAALPGGGPYVVMGLLERVPKWEGRVYNTAVLVGPEGLVGIYRKAHLPLLGVDRFAIPGDTGFCVWETTIGTISMIICYDLRFPEAMRVLALEGADIIALPTNWPDGSQNAPEFVTRTRALENRVFVVACNRCGEESDFWFFGRSQVTDPDGHVLVELADQEGIGYATITPEDARQKRIILRQGEFELDTVGDRRPDLYARLSKA